MNRPAFKNSELGPIPADWEVKRLGEICDDCGYGIGAEAVPFDGTNKYIRITDIDERSHRFKPSPLCSPSFVLEDRVVRRGDILVARTGASVGKSYIYDETDGHLLFAGFLMRVHVAKAEPRFVFYTTTTPQFAQWVLQESARSGQPGLNLAQLRTFCLAIPPLTEQRRIAAALSDADAWIESLDNLIEKKKLVKHGAMQALLSGKIRLPGFSGEWGAEALGDEFDFLRTNTLSRACLGESGRIADVHYGDVLVRYGNILDFSAETPPFIGEGHESRSIGDFLQAGDLVVADTAEDETVGKAVEIQHLGNRQAVAGLHTVACRPKQPFAPGWLGHFINSPFFHDQLLPLISGTKVSSISKENLKTVFVRRPPLAEQAAIASVLSGMDAELAALSREKAKAEQIKQGMMQELLTGRTRMRGFAARGEAQDGEEGNV